MDNLMTARDEALARLEQFAPMAGRHYAARRNDDLGPGHHDHVSCLSRYVRHRVVTETEILSEVLKHHSPEAAEKFIAEVFWRGYFKGWLEMRPFAWNNLTLHGEWTKTDVFDGLRVQQGSLGMACMDDWQAELLETGYLHNHARMWFASIWIFTLGLPWQAGARLFMEHLKDGDPASNSLSWRWVAGIHTIGKHYLARAENIMRCTAGRVVVREYLNEGADALPCADHPAPRRIQNHTAMPKKGGLLVLHDDDLDGDHYWQELLAPKKTMVVNLAPHRAQKMSEHVTNFVGALCDEAATSHGGQQLGPNPDEVVLAFKETGASHVVVPHAPVGPASTWLEDLKTSLKAQGIAHEQPMRRYDELVWPHAKKGFFPVKKQIPSILEELGLV